jgi:hypothetical protein
MGGICEVCGRTSSTEKICSHCGAEIFPDLGPSNVPVYPQWGWGTIGLGAVEEIQAEQIIRVLRKYWGYLETGTFLALMHSQLSAFASGTKKIKVLVKKDFFTRLVAMSSEISGSVQTDFQPVEFLTAKEGNNLLEKAGLVRV